MVSTIARISRQPYRPTQCRVTCWLVACPSHADWCLQSDAMPRAYSRLQALLKQIQYDSGAAAKTKTLGPAISINIAQLYTAKELS